MAAIDTYISQIQQAVYGEEVRGAIVSAILQHDSDMRALVSSAAASATAAHESEVDAETAAANLTEFTESEITTILNNVFGS